MCILRYLKLLEASLNPTEEKKYMDVELAKLRLLRLQFQNKLKDLKVLKLSLEDALEQETSVTKNEVKILSKKLKDLSLLKQNITDLVESFNVDYGLQAPDETEIVNKTSQDVVDAYYNLKLEVERLIRRLGKRSTLTETVTKEDEKECVDIVDDEKVKDAKIEKTVEKTEKEADVAEEEPASLKRFICKGIVISMLFYSCLGLIIKFVLDGRVKSAREVLGMHTTFKLF